MIEMDTDMRALFLLMLLMSCITNAKACYLDTFSEIDTLLTCVKADIQEDIHAQYSLGVMYRDGLGVTQDDKKAIAWYQKAAEQDDVRAQYELANLLFNGPEPDYKEASVWYYMAAALHEHPESQYRLGEIHAEGLGVTKDATEARKWYLKAARQGVLAP